jgi:hypothetical protein
MTEIKITEMRQNRETDTHTAIMLTLFLDRATFQTIRVRDLLVERSANPF